MYLAKKDKRLKIVLLSLLLSVSLLPGKDPGLKAFYRGDPRAARRYYEKRLQRNADDERLLYNLGTAELTLENHEKAGDLLKRSLSSGDPTQCSRAHYNLGQMALKQQEMDEAIEHFRKSMLYDPDDLDSKIMYEQLRKLKQEMQDQQEEQDQDPDQQKEDQENASGGESGTEKEDRHQEQAEGPQDNGDEDHDPEKGDNEAKQQEGSRLKEEDLKAEELSKEQAENILNAMKEKEQESMKKLILNRSSREKIKRSKEW